MSCIWPAQKAQDIDYISSAPNPHYCEKIPRSLVILGSTGSIGRNALDIVAKKPDFFNVLALAAGRNTELLCQQAILFKPPYLAILDEEYAIKLKKCLPDNYRPIILQGQSGYAQLASLPGADCILSAQMGAAGLYGTLSAALAGKVIALANKESLVIAGDLLRKVCGKSGATILPVDSEHYALFQCLSGNAKPVENLILTASGGPFRGKTARQLKNMPPEAALKHPNWQMGSKITIDSATLMNKGLEYIEAMHLYGVGSDKMKVLIHPQSIVHSLVCFKDNSFLAQLATPDMRLPLGACLCWPWASDAFVPPLNLAEIGTLTFEKPDVETFRCLALAREAATNTEPNAWSGLGLNPFCIALNAANEIAVSAYISGRCGFCDIPDLIAFALASLKNNMPAPPSIHDPGPSSDPETLANAILWLDQRVRDEVEEHLKTSMLQ